MWEMIEVTVGPVRHRGRFRVEGKHVVLEWRGGRTAVPLGWARPDVTAAQRLHKLVAQAPLAA